MCTIFFSSIELLAICFKNCTVRKNCFSDREKRLKFEAEGGEFAMFLRSLDQFIQTVNAHYNI